MWWWVIGDGDGASVVFDELSVGCVVGLSVVCVDSVVSPVFCCLWGDLLVICERNL